MYMYSKQIIYLLVLIISLPFSLICQNTLSIKKHKNALLELENGDYLNFEQIELDLKNKIVKGYNINQSDVIVDFQNIYAIQAQQGHKGFGRGLIGAGIGLLVFSGILYSAGWDEIDSDVKTSTINKTFFGLIGTGFGIGFAIGVKQKKHKRIYYDGKYLLPIN